MEFPAFLRFAFTLDLLYASYHLDSSAIVLHTHIYIYIYIGGEGVRSKWNGEPPYREIDFGFVFVRAVRAGEAKLRGRARGKSPVAEARPDQKLLLRAAGGARCPAGVPPVSRRCPVGVPIMMLMMMMIMMMMMVMMVVVMMMTVILTMVKVKTMMKVMTVMVMMLTGWGASKDHPSQDSFLLGSVGIS